MITNESEHLLENEKKTTKMVSENYDKRKGMINRK